MYFKIVSWEVVPRLQQTWTGLYDTEEVRTPERHSKLNEARPHMADASA